MSAWPQLQDVALALDACVTVLTFIELRHDKFKGRR
jgi:hypothetical protein